MKKYKQTIVGFVIGMGVFLGTFFALDFSIIASIIFSAIGYFGGFMLSKPQIKLGGVVIDSISNAAELKEIMLEAERDLAGIDRASRKALNPTIKEKSKKLYDSGCKILQYITANPQKISSSRRFLSYYLDTASNILDKYQKLTSTKYNTEEMVSLTQNTDKALDVLNEAFDKQFKRLIENEMFDIEADIKVLEDTLKSEG